MAIYSTFFVCKRDEVAVGFPGWKPPLPEPVERITINPFTREPRTIKTRAPEWDEDDGHTDVAKCNYQVVTIDDNKTYADYLEGRSRPFVRNRPHWCAKGFTQLEMEPLHELCGRQCILEQALFSPPSLSGQLFEFHPELVRMLVMIDSAGKQKLATQWAARMSTPDYTHTVSGVRIQEDWTSTFALSILEPIINVARKSVARDSLYFLVE